MEEQSPQSQPQQQEEHPLAHLGNWKTVGGIGVVIVVILIFSFLLTLFQAHMYPQQKTATSSPQTSITKENKEPTPVFVDQDNPVLTQQHLSNSFSMKYPSGWTESETQSLGSTMVTFTDGQKVASPAPQMIVASLDLTQASYTLSSGADLYRDYGYKETAITIDHLKAVKLTGIFPPEEIKSTYSGYIEWDTRIYVTKGTNDYAIRYIYAGTKENDTYERLFSAMLSTLQLR